MTPSAGICPALQRKPIYRDRSFFGRRGSLDARLRWASQKPRQACPKHLQLAHCHTPRQRYIARQRCQRYRACPLSHPLPTVTLPHSSPLSRSSPAIYSSLMVYRSPIATVYQLPQSLPTVHSLPTVTQLANDVQITNYYSLLAATELTSFHRACQLP
jgi:hypothetical protein